MWTSYEPRTFAQFVEPWRLGPVVTDGSRRVTLVEGTAPDVEMASFALIEARVPAQSGQRMPTGARTAQSGQIGLPQREQRRRVSTLG